MNKKTDLIIIGGGVLGSFHAYHALKKGLSVRLFERHHKAQGASVRNFGQVVPSGMNIKWQQHGRRSLEIYKNIQDQYEISLRQNGSIYLASDEEELLLLNELNKINSDQDYESVLLSKKECLSKYPGLRADYCKGGLFFPQEITVEARQMIHLLMDILKSKVNMYYHSSTQIREVLKINDGCKVVDHDGKSYEAAKVILCSGHEFKTLFPKLFRESDLEISKLQMLQTVSQGNTRVDGNILTGLSIRRYEAFRECPSYENIKSKENQEAFWKKWGIHILFKQCPDGSFIIGDSHEYADAKNADNIGFDIYPEVNAYMINEAKKIFNLKDWTIEREWFGIYSQCKNHDIFLEVVDQDIHIVTGIGGKGMTASAGFSEKHLQNIIGY